jgi:hypothetical protein
MSGSPKWVEAIIIGAVLAGIQNSRYRRARQEEQLRVDAALRVRLEQAEHRQQNILREAEQLSTQLNARRQELDPSVEIRLSDELARAIQTLRNTTDYQRVTDMAPVVQRVRGELNQALAKSQAAAREAELQQIAETTQRDQVRINDLVEQLAELERQGARELDGKGRQEVLDHINNARAELQGGDATARDYQLRLAGQALARHRATVDQARAQQAAEQLAAEKTVDEMAQVVAGIQADPNVMRWVAPAVEEMTEKVEQARRRFKAGERGGLEQVLAALRAEEQALVEKANAAQLKADQRDYIAASLRQVLENMGFIVGKSREEHEGHPATALLLNAVNAQGQGLSVSVPVDGEVWYDVDGYALSTESKVGGGTAAVCDEAEAVIDELHEALEQEFEVRTGELMWENKDPQRILRSADELPRSGDAEDRGESR